MNTSNIQYKNKNETKKSWMYFPFELKDINLIKVSLKILYKMEFIILIQTSSLLSNEIRGFTSQVMDIIAVSESASHI